MLTDRGDEQLPFRAGEAELVRDLLREMATRLLVAVDTAGLAPSGSPVRTIRLRGIVEERGERDDPAARPLPREGRIEPGTEIVRVRRGPFVQCVEELDRRERRRRIMIEDVEVVIAALRHATPGGRFGHDRLP